MLPTPIRRFRKRSINRLRSVAKPLTRWPSKDRRNGTPIRVLWRSAFRRRFDNKIGFVIAGAMRCGTSALFEYVRQHPEICCPTLKEVHYFDDDRFFQGEPDYSKYHAWFDPKPRHKTIGEATPRYMYRPRAIERMYQYNPEMKVICILRDPVERAYSHWNKFRLEGAEKESFSDLVERHKRAVERAQLTGSDAAAVEKIDRGFYAEQVENIWSHFSREQTLFFRNEELRKDPEGTLSRLFEFVGVRAIPLRPIKRDSSAAYPGQMLAADRAYLNQIYRPSVDALARMLDWDLSHWLKE